MRDIDKYTLDYNLSMWENYYQVRYRRKKVLDCIRMNKYILEIGCGMDTIANYLDDFNHFVIVEPSDQFLEKAKNDTIGKSDRMTYISGGIEEKVEAIKDLQLDCIIISSLLHEVENPKKILQSIFLICDNNNIVHINVPNANSFHRLLAVESGLVAGNRELSKRNKALQQHNVFELQSLKELVFRAANQMNRRVEILEEGSYFVKPFTHKQMEDALNNGILNEYIIEGLDKMIKYMPDLGSEIYLNFRVM